VLDKKGYYELERDVPDDVMDWEAFKSSVAHTTILYSPQERRFGFRLEWLKEGPDECFVKGIVWGFNSFHDARTAAVTFIAGWCARMRKERRETKALSPQAT